MASVDEHDLLCMAWGRQLPHVPRIRIAEVNGYEDLNSSYGFLSEFHYGILPCLLHIEDAIHVLDPFQVGPTAAGSGTRLCLSSELIPITL